MSKRTFQPNRRKRVKTKSGGAVLSLRRGAYILFRRLARTEICPVLLFSLLGFLAMGYHPGAEDDDIYLSAVNAAVNPSLYLHDSAFFKLQMRTSVFDTWMAYFVHTTGISVAWSEFAWQSIFIFLMVWACWLIISQFFEDRAARWGGIAMFSAMLTLPVAGTALYLADQYLHPRNPATALILFAVYRIMAGRRWQALPLLLLASILHPLMGAFGVSFCVVLSLTTFEPLHDQIRSWRERKLSDTTGAAAPIAGFIPFAWLFSKPSHTFLSAMAKIHCYYLYNWTWYEWLGAIGPLVIFWVIARIARTQGQLVLSRFATAVLIYGTFQQVVAMIILGPAAPLTFGTLEPMRFLQLVYVFMTLILGAYLGHHVLGRKLLRWTVFLLLANGGMYLAQRQLFAGTEHFEFPGLQSANPWLQAFSWIRHNTPEDAYFAVDPNYMSVPGEDNHGFRALAERSVLADEDMDTDVVTKAPELGPEWKRQVQAESGWVHFRLADFERLESQFGVNWTLVRIPQPAGLDCRWHSQELAVCRIPRWTNGPKSATQAPDAEGR